ncbi:MAG: zinc ribbon domain-containing protein [Nanoarchaeota archaeon]
MAKIHGIVYLIIGLFISIASYYIKYDKLYPFFYVGLLFITFGVAKIVIGFINKEEKKQSPLNRLNPNQFRQAPKQQYKRCPTCGNVARASDNFCARCGNRLY